MRSIKPQERDEVRHLWNRQPPGGSYGTHSNPRLASQSLPCAKNSNILFQNRCMHKKCLIQCINVHHAIVNEYV